MLKVMVNVLGITFLKVAFHHFGVASILWGFPDTKKKKKLPSLCLQIVDLEMIHDLTSWGTSSLELS